jgi:hypothetical protein
LTDALCEDVFDECRTTERRRDWTLSNLARFWTAVVLRAPSSLRQALSEATGTAPGGYPQVAASAQAFFQRSQDLRPEFFRGLFEAFVSRVASEPLRYAAEHAALAERFESVLVVDGSKLDAVARRLRLCWKDRRVPLPGALLALYDLRRGVLSQLHLDADAARGEMPRVKEVLPCLAPETLLLGDRAFGVPAFFAALTERGLFGLCRRGARVRWNHARRLTTSEFDGGTLEDFEVDAGVSHKTATQRLRCVRWRKGGKTLELFTNVLDPSRLSAEEAMRLYRQRWKVERLFYDLKEVLDLHSFYGANFGAVAMQVYATAIVHTAMRTAQSRIAHALRRPPEDLSPAKLYPKVAAASSALTTAEITFAATQALNPKFRLRKPDWRTLPFASTPIESVLVETRSETRKSRRFCASRGRWRSLPGVRRRGSSQS